MTELTRNRNKKTTQAQTPVEYIVTALAIWKAVRGVDLPQPCPTRLEECAQWWLNHMQKPNTDMEFARAALINFLELKPTDRRFVVAAKDDGVFYRGEHPTQFQEIYEETQHMRNAPDVYKTKAMKRMKQYLKRPRGMHR